MTEERWAERALLTRLAEASRVTQAIKRDGTRVGMSCCSWLAAGVTVPEGEGEELALREERALRMPERIAIPRVPETISISLFSSSWYSLKLAAS